MAGERMAIRVPSPGFKACWRRSWAYRTSLWRAGALEDGPRRRAWQARAQRLERPAPCRSCGRRLMPAAGQECLSCGGWPGAAS